MLDGEGPDTLAVPDLQKAIFDKAWRAMERGEFDDALALAAEGILLDRLRAVAWNTYGQLLRSAGRTRDAEHCFTRAIRLAPGDASSWSELAVTLALNKSLSRSLACHEHAMRLAPDRAELHHNRGAALMLAGREREAIQSYDQALALRPKSPKTRWERGLCRLRLGQFERGWEDYEVRLTPPVRKSAPPPPLPRWTGEPLQGRRILVLAEQGLGDMIWCARYLASLKQQGAHVVLQCGVELIELMRPLPGADEIIRLTDPTPYADLYIEMCSLPGVFTPSLSAVAGGAYIRPIEGRRNKFASWLNAPGQPLKIGMVWSGNPRFPTNKDRSASAAGFLHALDQPGVQLYSLQKGSAAGELDRIGLPPAVQPRVIDLAPLLDDLADTAEVCAQLDLVVTTDTSMAHLAGAMGRPVWLLLNLQAYWLWGREGASTPWYDSMTIFRAERWDDWNGVLDRAGEALFQRLTGAEQA